MERVLLVFENEGTGEKIRALLEQTGAARGILCRTAAQARVLAAQQGISVVICSYRFPDGSARELFYDLPRGSAMVLLARQDMQALWMEGGVFRLSPPITRRALLDTLRAALSAARRDTRPARSEEERALIARAKAVLMERRGIGEGEAHRLLQKRSMDEGRKLSDTARLLLEEAERRIQ